MGKIMYNGKPYSGSFDKAVNVTYDNSNSGLASKNVQAATDEVNAKANKNANDIGTLNTKSIKTEDVSFLLKNLSWTKSGGGMYYAKVTERTFGSKIISVTVCGFGSIDTTFSVHPYISGGNYLGVYSPVNSYGEYMQLNLRVAYID